ncbi:ribosome maturation factor RimM [Mucilaginibacter arboris]|uniref:Ribosome maturation factor RimM n=1 Tax=Mucilaginibacter arboris TaxID=2682090 RepID=A0A7K1SSF8_9SPHI|nr:ribosome maturation factor RimM [Mucilaginibacter arboris]MVN20235.1 16S rRNA processing protein RimM [Mucilaginibacter arboris]
MTTEDCFHLGAVTKTRGLKGELQLFIAFDEPEKLKFNTLFIELAGKLVPYFVTFFKLPQKNMAYLQLEDVDTVEKAALLVKKAIYLPNKVKPKKKKSEFGLKDLLNFIAVDVNEGELGEIIEINQFPQQLIATVSYKNQEVLFPLNESIIKSIDVVKGVVLVDLPEGLLDVYLD